MGIHLNLNPMLDVYNSYNISIWLQSSVYYCNHKRMLEGCKLIPIWFHYNLYAFSSKCRTYFYGLQVLSSLNSNKTLVCMGAHLNLKI
jgi:hypothetical protein